MSRVGDREGESFGSPSEQTKRIEDACERENLQLIDVIREMDVSGGTPLEKRKGLRGAVERVEAGEADVIVVAYLDRLVRSYRVQAEVVERIEAAGGAVLAVDVGQLTNGSAGQWLSAGMLGLVSEYHRRTTAERTAESKRRAIARGVPTFNNIPPGYRQREDRTLEPDPVTAPIVREAFELRADGATVKQVREHLSAAGIERSFHGVQSLLASRIVLGELHFGRLANEEAHLAIVPRELFERVQKMRLPRGRRPKSERLLARQGVLRCETCGSRMVVGTTVQQGRTHGFYRCPPIGDCSQRVTISADVAEAAIIAAVQELLADVAGSASVESGVLDAERTLGARQSELDAAIRTLAPVADEEAAKERLAALLEARDVAQNRLADLVEASAPAVTVTAGDWDVLTLAERRSLIRATIAEAVVAPGRGSDRITITPRGE